MVHHLRHLATRVTIASVLNWQVQLMNVNLDGTVPWEPMIRNQLITLLVIFAPKATTVLEEVMHQNDALLVLFSTQLETGIVNTIDLIAVILSRFCFDATEMRHPKPVVFQFAFQNGIFLTYPYAEHFCTRTLNTFK